MQLDRPKRLVCTLLCVAALAGSAAVADTLVVANKAEASASLIDLDRGKVVATLPTGQGPHEVAISPDGRLALVANYGRGGEPGSTLTLIDVGRAEVVKTVDLGPHQRPHGIVFLADDRYAVVTAEESKALLRVDVEKGKVVEVLETGAEVSHMVAMTADGRRAFVANIGSGSVTVLDLEGEHEVTSVATGEGAEGVTVAAGGRQAWVTNRAADTVTVLDARSLEILATIESIGFPIRATATPDGSQVLVTRARAGDVVVYDTEALGEGRAVPLDVPVKDVEDRLFGDRFGDSSVPIGVVISRDGTRAFIAHANADVISEHDLKSWKRTRLLTAGREPDGMGYSPVVVERR